MTTDEVIKKLGITPHRPNLMDIPLDAALGSESISRTIESRYYTHSDLDRIVAELSAGYEAQIKVLRDALEVYGQHEPDCSWLDIVDIRPNCTCGLFEALSQSAPE